MKRFNKSFTQQEAIPQVGIDAAVEVLQSGRLHRYNTAPGELGETARLEQEYAAFQGASYALAVTSGGQAIQIALRAAGVARGDKILANAYTLAPVPGAIYAVGAVPVFVEIGDDWLTEIDDLRSKARVSDAKFLMLSHMRGHIADMDAICDICDEFSITLIEDCAHTMGAAWKGRKSGNFGKVACFSTQTYKHINSGEGGLLTTDDADLAARATILSGSYMLYERHGASPSPAVFDAIRLGTPNCSARLDNLRAAILRAQLPQLENNIRRWNVRYQIIEAGLKGMPGVRVVERPQHEDFVGSSIQFHVDGIDAHNIPDFVDACMARGVELKWFGAQEPIAFTSRYDSWRYLDDIPHLPKTLKALAATCDMRVPLTFSEMDCQLISEIIAEEAVKAIL
ncbi:MAG: dTDP-4-amino-4,6-dideoxygalactose transaminase [Gammaproteobacteria bacterium]|jgi:dTDP-4-amino-4,6-dideoxygalactose transaminase